MNEVKFLKANSKKGFNFLAGINREIIPSHVSKIAESIATIGTVTRPVIIAEIEFLDNEKRKYIIDGQHLYTACLRLKLDIPYIVIPIQNTRELIEKIALLNASSKNWGLNDYINTWSYYNDDYKELKRLFNLYNIERTILIQLLHTGVVSANAGGGNTSVSKYLKNGNFRIINLEMAIKVLDYIADLRSITKDLGRIEQKVLISVLIEKIKSDGENYNHQKYKAYLNTVKKELVLASNDLTVIRNILNK